jgi:hypothetical protein
MALLEGISAPDLGLFIAGEDFAATTDMTEEFGQNVTYNGAFGSVGPVLRQERNADENTHSFTVILLKNGVAKGMNNEDDLRALRDFDIITKRGAKLTTYTDCNWTRITITSGLDQVTLSADISVPGFSE